MENTLQRQYKVIIVGGGASGLLCAVELLQGSDKLNPKDLLLLEANDRVGKKLIATGNGQGNLLNKNFSKEKYHGEDSFISTFIQSTNQINLESYFNSLGIPLCTLEDGKQYPVSRQANSFLDVIRMFLEAQGCQILTNSLVQDISYFNGIFTVSTQNQKFNSQNVVLAFGGKAGKQFGTDGKSYHLAKKFSHKVTDLYPSLVQLKTPTNKIKGLKGLKENVIISAYSNGKYLSSAKGEILFTEYGISGSAVFYISSYITDKPNASVKIEFLPEYSITQVKELLQKRSNMAHIKPTDILTGIINKKIGQALIKDCKDLSPSSIATLLKNFQLEITGNLGFNYAQVTKGGIDTSDIEATTMQSKLQKGLYVIGEALNVDGDCGGYNLTFAFSTAITSAKHIKRG